ncbi:MAG: hypothetical protein HLUCCA11_15560 [Phormidesmis priestleyi Ana]|uniref:Uncharacterized protein n=1 Tax=Phormidesmis priestleyi Ana TaxID=1666911 RepID=A0A0P8BKU6_9CYAN|nr:MAG: hypothetical protein HLUCCA11_15560 [Phormidesmis priestleyi Ana]
MTPAPPNPRESLYFALIDRLLNCPNGEEPTVLNSEPELLDAGFVQALMQTASYFAHQDNPESAKFLVFIARELAQQLGMRPKQVQAQA